MQTKTFAAAVVALSLSSVEGAALQPRQNFPGGVVTTLGAFSSPNLASGIMTTLQIAQGDLSKINVLVNDLSQATTGNVQDVLNQVQLLMVQLNRNLVNVGANVNTLTTGLGALLSNVGGAVGGVVGNVAGVLGGVLGGLGIGRVPANVVVATTTTTASATTSPTPSASSSAVPDIGGAAEDLVRQAQALAQSIALQINAVFAQYMSQQGFWPLLVQIQMALAGTVNYLQATTSQVLGTVAIATSGLPAIAARVRNAQLLLPQAFSLVPNAPAITFPSP